MNNAEEQKLKAIVEKILQRANIQNDEHFGSIITILMMISIVLTVIRIIQECNKNKINNLSAVDQYAFYGEQIRSFGKKRGWFTRMRLKKILRNKLSPEAYKQYGSQLIDGILDTGASLTDEETITLVEAANV